MEIVTSFHTLMHYANAVGLARKSGDKDALSKAVAEHDAYAEMCIASDRMTLGMTEGELFRRGKDRQHDDNA